MTPWLICFRVGARLGAVSTADLNVNCERFSIRRPGSRTVPGGSRCCACRRRNSRCRWCCSGTRRAPVEGRSRSRSRSRRPLPVVLPAGCRGPWTCGWRAASSDSSDQDYERDVRRRMGDPTGDLVRARRGMDRGGGRGACRRRHDFRDHLVTVAFSMGARSACRSSSPISPTSAAVFVVGGPWTTPTRTRRGTSATRRAKLGGTCGSDAEHDAYAAFPDRRRDPRARADPGPEKRMVVWAGTMLSSHPRRWSRSTTSSPARCRPTREEGAAVSGRPYDHAVPLRVVPTPYGRAAAEALRVEIARCQGRVRRSRPSPSWCPVTRWGSRRGGCSLRASSADLARGLRPHRRHVPHELPAGRAPRGARLAAVGRRPVSTPVVAAAVRRVLATDPGRLFAPVAGHPATEEALVGVHRDLSDLDDPALGALAEKSERAREVVRIHRLVKERLAPKWYDEHDLMRAANEVVHEGSPMVAELGTNRVSSPAAHHHADRAAVARLGGATSWS